MSEVVASYEKWRPDTSDKREDECWVDYWDRKRRERHDFPNCNCMLCEHEKQGLPVSHATCADDFKLADLFTVK